MKIKRIQRFKPSFQDLDQYESSSSSSSSGIEFERVPCKRKSHHHDIRIPRRRSSSYGLRNRSKLQSNTSQVPEGLSDQSSTSTSSSSVINRTWKPKDVNTNKTEPPRNDKKKTPVLSTFERKKQELEKARREDIRREKDISVAGNQLIDKLVCMGVTCRDVAQLCSEKLGWTFTEWKNLIKGSKVTIYEPIAKGGLPSRKESYSSNKKTLTPYSRTWSSSLEVEALSFCILKSGGTRVSLQDGFRSQLNLTSRSKHPPGSEVITNISELKCVFVHRSVIKNFMSEKQPSVTELTRIKPRLQIFVFGNGPEPTSREMILISPKVELILCAGTIIIPTFNSLFKKGRKNSPSGKEHFNRLKKLCVYHPFLKVCLHPSMRRQLSNCLSSSSKGAGIDVEFFIEFLASPNFDHLAQTKPAPAKDLANWINLDRNNICWLWSDSEDDDDHHQLPKDPNINEEILEVLSIVKTLKLIQLELYTEFRRFVIALHEDHPYSNRSSIEGIELMEIGKIQDCDLI